MPLRSAGAPPGADAAVTWAIAIELDDKGKMVMHLRLIPGRRAAALLLLLGGAGGPAAAADAPWRAVAPLPASAYMPVPLFGARPAALPEDDCDAPLPASGRAGGAGGAGGFGAPVALAVASPIPIAAPPPPALPVAMPAPAPAPAPPSWQLRASDRTLNAALARWAASVGWQLVWEVPADYAVESDTSIHGTFEQAVDMVAASMATAEVPMKAIFYQGNHVLRIVAKGKP